MPINTGTIGTSWTDGSTSAYRDATGGYTTSPSSHTHAATTYTLDEDAKKKKKMIEEMVDEIAKRRALLDKEKLIKEKLIEGYLSTAFKEGWRGTMGSKGIGVFKDHDLPDFMAELRKAPAGMNIIFATDEALEAIDFQGFTIKAEKLKDELKKLTDESKGIKLKKK